MAMGRKVAVAIVNWRRAADTLECLTTLIEHSPCSLDIVVVDNGSGDGSAELIASRFPQVRLIALDRNEGYVVGINLAISEALKGDPEFILVMNNDAVSTPGYLEPLLDIMDRRPRCGIAGSKILYYDTGLVWFGGGTYNRWLGYTRHQHMDEEAAADLMAWVMDGGRLICVGPSSLPFCQKLVDKRWTGPDDFLRVKYQRLNGYRIDAVEASTYAQALSLRTSAPVWALEKRYLDDLGAITIGYLHHDEDGDLVTSAMVPLGEGRLILFGGPVSQPSVVAGDAAISWDIVQLIVSGALWSTAEPEFTAFPLSADARAGTFISSMDGDLVVLAYSPQSHVPLYGRTVVAAS